MVRQVVDADILAGVGEGRPLGGLVLSADFSLVSTARGADALSSLFAAAEGAEDGVGSFARAVAGAVLALAGAWLGAGSLFSSTSSGEVGFSSGFAVAFETAWSGLGPSSVISGLLSSSAVERGYLSSSVAY